MLRSIWAFCAGQWRASAGAAAGDHMSNKTTPLLIIERNKTRERTHKDVSGHVIIMVGVVVMVLVVLDILVTQWFSRNGCPVCASFQETHHDASM